MERGEVFSRFLKIKNLFFYFLQETYSDASDESFWKSEWGGDIVFSHGSHHGRGVYI